MKLAGYLAGGGTAALAAAAVAALLIAGGGGGDDAGGSGARGGRVLPDGGTVPALGGIRDLKAAASNAGCTLRTVPSNSREHTTNLNERIDYPSNPPVAGRHHESDPQDGAYEQPLDPKLLVHALEHGRIVIWFREEPLDPHERANLYAFYERDPDRVMLVPDSTDMPYEVAAGAWRREPTPNGSGRLLGCPYYYDAVFTALEAFKLEHRGRSPEPRP